jgi:hypothetical protein
METTELDGISIELEKREIIFEKKNIFERHPKMFAL